MMLGYKAIWCDAIEVTRPYGVMLGFKTIYGVMLGHKAIWCDAGFQGHMVGCWVTRPYGMWHGVHRGAWKPEQHA